MTIFAHWEMLDLGELFSQDSKTEEIDESFANFLKAWNSLKIKKLKKKKGYKTLHLSLKKHSICENQVREIIKSSEINALGFKETSSYGQMTSSKSYIQDCCRSLSFG